MTKTQYLFQVIGQQSPSNIQSTICKYIPFDRFHDRFSFIEGGDVGGTLGAFDYDGVLFANTIVIFVTQLIQILVVEFLGVVVD